MDSKRSKREDEDRISGLPDDVLSHILSLLPLQDAIQSILLLKRFTNLRRLWRSFTKLNLDTYSTFKQTLHSHSNDKKVAKIIHHIILYHDKMEIDELCLRHYFYFEYSKDPYYSMNPSPEIQSCILEEKWFAGVIDSFVAFAIIKRCKVLTLDFLDTGVAEEIMLKENHELQQGYILPTIVYRSIHLTQLTLQACDITSCDEVCLTSLKLLRFTTVAVSDEALQKFMSGCPLLEELSLSCYGLHNLCCSSVKLKKLEIDHWEPYSLTVSNLNVVFLKISGFYLQNVVLLNSNVCNAQVFSRDMMDYYEMRPHEGFKFILQALDQCKTFRACLWSLKVLALWELTNIPCPYFKCTCLLLDKLWLTSSVQVGLSTLLRHVPLLRTLKIHVEPRPSVVWNDGRKRLEENELDDEDKYWNEAKANLENLKMVVIHGSCITEEPGVIRVAKFLLRNAVALEKIVVSASNNVELNDPSHIFTSGGDMKPEKDGILTDRLRCILGNLVASPKASPKAMICFK